jgi:hypothetical protein
MKKLAVLAVLSACVGTNDDGGGFGGVFGDEGDGMGNPFNQQDDVPAKGPEQQGPAVCGEAEVHVIGVYETHSESTRGAGNALVNIARPGLHSLVLSSYEATNWQIQLGAGVRIKSIHLVGYHAQTVMPPHEGITITTDTLDQTKSGACGYSWPYNGEGCNTNQLLAIARHRTGSEVASFHGCYEASKWMLDPDANASGNCNVGAGYHVNEMKTACMGKTPIPFSPPAPSDDGGDSNPFDSDGGSIDNPFGHASGSIDNPFGR